MCDDNLDNLVGFVSLKDLFRQGIGESEFAIRQHLRKPAYLPENMAAYRVLEQFKASRVHSAFVVDEYGSLQGIVTMDDVMDELIVDTVEAADEYQLVQRNANSWLVDGQYPYFELLDYFDLPKPSGSESFATVGGLFISISHRIPVAGETVEWLDYNLEVVDMDGHRIDKIMITKR